MEMMAVFKKCLRDIESSFDRQTFEKLMEYNYKDIKLVNFGVGRWVYDNLLNENGDLYKAFVKGGVTDRDDMLLLIMSLLYIDIHTRESE